MYDPKKKCTCTFTGPRPLPGESMCQNCKDFHSIFFPAFPGDPKWRLNHGAIDRNSWGIRPAKVATRDIENVSDLQIAAAHRAVSEAVAHLELLEHYQFEERR